MSEIPERVPCHHCEGRGRGKATEGVDYLPGHPWRCGFCEGLGTLPTAEAAHDLLVEPEGPFSEAATAAEIAEAITKTVPGTRARVAPNGNVEIAPTVPAESITITIERPAPKSTEDAYRAILADFVDCPRCYPHGKPKPSLLPAYDVVPADPECALCGGGGLVPTETAAGELLTAEPEPEALTLADIKAAAAKLKAATPTGRPSVVFCHPSAIDELKRAHGIAADTPNPPDGILGKYEGVELRAIRGIEPTEVFVDELPSFRAEIAGQWVAAEPERVPCPTCEGTGQVAGEMATWGNPYGEPPERCPDCDDGTVPTEVAAAALLTAEPERAHEPDHVDQIVEKYRRAFGGKAGL